VKGTKHGQFTAAAAGSTDEKFAPLQTVKLQLNGHDRFTERRGSFFNNCQPYEHFQSIPSAGIYLYSFSLKPAEHRKSPTPVSLRSSRCSARRRRSPHRAPPRSPRLASPAPTPHRRAFRHVQLQ
jgi:hypothetical protein